MARIEILDLCRIGFFPRFAQMGFAGLFDGSVHADSPDWHPTGTSPAAQCFTLFPPQPPSAARPEFTLRTPEMIRHRIIFP